MTKFTQLFLMLVALPAMAESHQTYVQHKTIHALGGIAVYEAFRAAGRPKTGLAVVLGLGIAKELYDRKHGGRFRGGDVAWTTAPATVTFVVRW